ncbi:MAG: hypothetical protein ACI8QC_000032 [Planctomycetota bacterium]|jgi:hypothetical protein
MDKPPVGEELTEVVRRWARPTTPEEMQARGVRAVRSISLSHMAALIEKAVNRTLLKRTVGEPGEDDLEFSQDARLEFMSLLQGEQAGASGQVADVKPTEAQAGSALERLKRDLRVRRRNLRQEEAALAQEPGVEGEEDGRLTQRLQHLFRAADLRSNLADELELRVIRLAVGELRQERARSRQVLIDQHRSETEVLGRRVTKLVAELKRTEGALARASRGVQEEDGVASIYDEVQGLGEHEEQAERKGALMSAIFEANLELQAKITAAEQNGVDSLSVVMLTPSARGAEATRVSAREDRERAPGYRQE